MTMGRSAPGSGPGRRPEIAQTLGLKDDVVGAGIDRRIGILGRLEGKIARFEGKLPCRTVSAGHGESPGLNEELRPGVVDLEDELVAAVPLDLNGRLGHPAVRSSLPTTASRDPNALDSQMLNVPAAESTFFTLAWISRVWPGLNSFWSSSILAMVTW